MEWLSEHKIWRFTAEQWAEYDRMVEPVRAEYNRLVVEPARAEYNRLVRRAAWAELCRVKANAIRQIIGNPFKG